jgi:hypothetical protein
LIYGSSKDNPRLINPTIKEVYPTVGGKLKTEETNQKALEGNKGSTCSG